MDVVRRPPEDICTGVIESRLGRRAMDVLALNETDALVSDDRSKDCDLAVPRNTVVLHYENAICHQIFSLKC